MTATMTPGERRQLAAVLKQQMRILRADIEQRRSELVAEAEARLMERYRDQDRAVSDANEAIRDVLTRAQGEINGIVVNLRAAHDGVVVKRPPTVSCNGIGHANEDRAQLHRALTAGIEAQVKSALLDLERKEADLLRQLALNSIESDEAREFLANIPKVAELVPAARLREIEAAFDAPAGGTR